MTGEWDPEKLHERECVYAHTRRHQPPSLYRRTVPDGWLYGGSGDGPLVFVPDPEIARSVPALLEDLVAKLEALRFEIENYAAGH